MPKLLRDVQEENQRQINAAATDYLDQLYGTVLKPDAPFRYDPPQRDVSRRPPFRKYFHYF